MKNKTKMPSIGRGYIVRLTRNAWYGHANIDNTAGIDSSQGNTVKDSSIYLVMDYYNRMVIEEISNPKTGVIENDFDPADEDENHPALSKLFMMFVELKGINPDVKDLKDDEDPFKNKSKSMPFFSLIHVIKVPNPAIDKEECDTFECLKSVYKTLERKTKASIKKYKKTSGYICARILYSINLGSFVVAVKSADIESAMKIARTIRGFQSSPTKNDYIFETFTTVSAQCLFDGSGMPIEYKASKGLASKVAIRLKLNDPEIADRLRGYVNKANDNELYELYGRYDVTLIISLERFIVLLPVLSCFQFKHVSGKNRKYRDGSLDSLKFNEDELLSYLVELIEEEEILTVNIRPLLMVEQTRSNAQSDTVRKLREIRKYFRETIKLQEKYLQNEIVSLKNSSYKIPFRTDDCFCEVLKLFEEMTETYSGIRLETDALVNSYIIFAQINIVMTTLESKLKQLENTTENRLKASICDQIVVWMRHAVMSIDSFCKLTQIVNFQSIQAPNFEMQTRIDMEKFAVAYSEFLGEYYKKYFDEYRSTLKYGEVRVYPVFTIDPAQAKIATYSLFPYVKPTVNPESESVFLLLSIKVPTESYFYRPYKTLPLLCHEISHSFRFVERDFRNKAFGGFAIRKVSEFLRDEWMNATLEKRYCPESIKAVILESISQVLYTAYTTLFAGADDLHNYDRDTLSYYLKLFFRLILIEDWRNYVNIAILSPLR